LLAGHAFIASRWRQFYRHLSCTSRVLPTLAVSTVIVVSARNALFLVRGQLTRSRSPQATRMLANKTRHKRATPNHRLPQKPGRVMWCWRVFVVLAQQPLTMRAATAFNKLPLVLLNVCETITSIWLLVSCGVIVAVRFVSAIVVVELLTMTAEYTACTT
jgi:hypothetical protein